MQDNAQTQRQLELSIFRYAFGVGLAVFLAAWIDWPLAFVAPVFTAKFLLDKPTYNWATVYELLIAMIVTMALGLVLSGGITEYPVALMCLVGLMMLWGYFLFTNPKWNLFATMLIIAVLMLPFVAMSSPSASLFLAFGLAVSGVVAVAIFALMHILMPDVSERTAEPAPMLTTNQRWYTTVRAMLISFPVVCFFFVFQISQALLTMMFIAVFSLMITKENSVKLSSFLVLSNAIGGAIAVVAFVILGLNATLGFYVIFITFLALIISTKIYTEPSKGAVYATAFSTVLVLLGNTLMSSGDIGNNMWVRIVQLVLTSVYMIATAYFLETRQWKFLQQQSL
ncbi:DUF2955 domain-containing protein [Shewanella maritima]|uniref:DUF2955 domain-containing protein n=1 Tax=Shewanella maritima TaxID=2520507 RepID=A0A411PE34_9GAMM|nr:DUF2955 domain-containing protein [Shewanella maritima]QBF81826.1 DUF2955 domain-containing protein [Shewanella maritima]